MNIHDIFEELAFIVSDYDEPNLKKEIELIVPINYYYGINKILKEDRLFSSAVNHFPLKPNVTEFYTKSGIKFIFKIKEFEK